MNRYDLRYTVDGLTIEPHFCRDYHCDDSHGWTWEEARQEVISELKYEIERMERITEEEYFK